MDISLDLIADAVFATKLLTAAESLYTFAKSNRGLYSECILEAKDFYRYVNFRNCMPLAD